MTAAWPGVPQNCLGLIAPRRNSEQDGTSTDLNRIAAFGEKESPGFSASAADRDARDQHNSLPQRELLVRPLLHGFIESRTCHENRSCSGDNPSDMKRVVIPQLHAKAHIGDVVQVWVLKLPQQFVHAFVETIVRPPNEVRFGTQTL